MRFAAANRQSSGNWINAGKAASKAAADIFATATAYGPDFGGMASAWQDARNKTQIKALQAQADVVQKGIQTSAQVQSAEYKRDAQKVQRDLERKTKFAGKLAAVGGIVAKGLDKPDKPLPPAIVDPAALEQARGDANEAAGLNRDGTRKTDVATPATPATPETTTTPEPPTTPASTSTPPAASGNSAMSFKKVYDMAVSANAQYPELVAAQWQLETGGTSGQGPTANNNVFAQKGTDFKADTLEHDGTKLVSAPGEGWKSYDSPQEATNWLVSNWYKDSQKHGQGVESRGGSREGAARQLVALGYATDPKYADKLLRIARDNGFG